MHKTKTQLFSLLLVLMLLCSLCATALALSVSDQDLFDWFEYYRDGTWNDLNTIIYRDTSTGNIGYCIEHEAKPPRESLNYVPYDPYYLFNSYTLTGIQAILNHGYPANSNGFSAESAFYATANAMRFWIKESCGQGYDFMYLPNGLIRVKSGGESVWNWCMELLQYARNQDTGGSASLNVSPTSPQWSVVNGQLTTTVSVSSSYGYSVTPSNSNINISGYTGGRRDTLTITAPTTLAGTDVSLYFTASAGSVSTVDLGFYEPYGSDRQKLVFVEMISGTTGQSQTLSITGSFADLVINKVDSLTGMPLNGASFQLFDSSGNAVKLSSFSERTGYLQADTNGSSTFTIATSGSIGIANLPVGSYELKEVSAPTGYALSQGTISIVLSSENTADNPARYTIQNEPLAMQLEKVDASDKSSLANVSFKVKNASGAYLRFALQGDGSYYVTDSGTDHFLTDAQGKASILYIPAGDYSLEEQQHPGFAPTGAQAFTVTSENALHYPSRIGVENWPLYLSITKTDKHDGVALENVKFKLLDSTGNAMKFTLQEDGRYKVDASGEDVLSTDAEGKILVSHIPNDSYSLVEQVYDGYALLAPVAVMVGTSNTEDHPVEVSISNCPTEFVLSKVASETKAKLAGVTFTLKDGNGETVSLARMTDGSYRPLYAIHDADSVVEKTEKITTVLNGQVIIRYLKYGQYSLLEDQVFGYAPLTDIGFTITANHSTEQPLTMTVENIPTSLVIHKADAVSKAPLPGTRFALLNQSDEKIPLVLIEGNTYRPARKGENGLDELTVGSDGTATVKYITGTVTVHESGAPAGFAYAADQTVELGISSISATNGDRTLAQTSVYVEDFPLMLKISKVHAKTLQPLKGAAFQIVADSNTQTPLTFVLKDGVYWYSEMGTVTTIYMDSNAQAYVCRLPAAKYRLIESVVPSGFFPAPAQDFTLLLTHTSEEPLEVTVTNTPEVKLGLDSDKWDDVLLIGGGALLLLGAAVGCVVLKRRKKRK